MHTHTRPMVDMVPHRSVHAHAHADRWQCINTYVMLHGMKLWLWWFERDAAASAARHLIPSYKFGTIQNAILFFILHFRFDVVLPMVPTPHYSLHSQIAAAGNWMHRKRRQMIYGSRKTRLPLMPVSCSAFCICWCLFCTILSHACHSFVSSGEQHSIRYSVCHCTAANCIGHGHITINLMLCCIRWMCGSGGTNLRTNDLKWNKPHRQKDSKKYACGKNCKTAREV